MKEKYKSELNFIKPTTSSLMEKKLRWGVEAENTGWKKKGDLNVIHHVP